MLASLDSEVFPLRSLGKLESLIGVSRDRMRRVAREREDYYNPKKVTKTREDGTVKVRYLDRPFGELKDVQGRLLDKIFSPALKALPEGMQGGRKSFSNITNAEYHTDQNTVAVLDICKCFPSTGAGLIFNRLMTHLGLGGDVTNLVVDLVTRGGYLPQGSPSSTAVLNLVLYDLFVEMNSVATNNGIILTNFVDDFAFSGGKVQVESSVQPLIGKISGYGYSVSSDKTNVMPSNTPQVVTGVLVNNNSPAIRNSYVEEVRAEIIKLGEKNDPVDEQEVRSIAGKINHISRLNYNKGDSVHKLAKKVFGSEYRHT